jgi:hypothetical protein
MRAGRACEILIADPARVRRWIAGGDPGSLTEHDLEGVPPIARVAPHMLTPAEAEEILAAADEDELAHLRRRKLAHHLSRSGRV